MGAKALVCVREVEGGREQEDECGDDNVEGHVCYYYHVLHYL